MEENRLEIISKELKEFLAKYDTASTLGHLSFMMTHITDGIAKEELKGLSSPMRQLYYLAGLMMTQEGAEEQDLQFQQEDWQHIVDLLNDIDNEYYKLFIPKSPEENTENWRNSAEVAMPTFLAYFNLGPLNYEEQVIDQIQGTFTAMDDVIMGETGVETKDLLLFYDNLDAWCQYNLSSLSQVSDEKPLRENWKDYTNIEIRVLDEVPDEIKALGEKNQPRFTLCADPGIAYRFKPADMETNGLSERKVQVILDLLSVERQESEYLYYSENNPLLTHPIVKLENGLYQVFEIKRVLHAILSRLEEICKGKDAHKSRLTHHKGHYLESKIKELFNKFFGKGVEIISNYFIDGCEQDIMVLWKNYMFVVEAKAYSVKEPFRNPEKAFIRIESDFNDCVGYAYTQTRRIEDKMRAGKIFHLCDKNGNVVRTINPEDYEENDFYIIVTQESFGPIQVDLSFLIQIEDDRNYPWTVRCDDLEVFLLTLKAKKKNPDFFVDFLIFRELLHGHIICMDEGEICGGFLTGKLTDKEAESDAVIVTTHDLASVFDEQYYKGMGFKNERHWKEKKEKKILGTIYLLTQTDKTVL